MRRFRRVITLTTDFGADSPYVAQMKASILAINLDAVIVDITHSVPAQDIYHAAFLLRDIVPSFPPGTIHVVVIDPGVGTDRSILLAQIGQQWVIAPDNGLIAGLAMDESPNLLFEVTDRKLWKPHVSNTFHGRDIMAPVAAHLSRDVHPAEVGPAITSYQNTNWTEPVPQGHSIAGAIVWIDAFGNLITNIGPSGMPDVDPGLCVVRCADRELTGLSATYGERPMGSLVAIWGSNGRLELAIVCGNAAQVLDAKIGDSVTISWKMTG